MDLLTIPTGTKAFKAALTHMTLNLSIVALFVIDFLWRHGSYYERTKPLTGQFVLSLVAIVLLLVSGWIGGMLSYKYGVRVADEKTQAEGFRR
jgi:uncharacterized membrane protein